MKRRRTITFEKTDFMNLLARQLQNEIKNLER